MEKVKRPEKVEEYEVTVNVPVKARFSNWGSGNKYLAIDDDDICKLWFMDKVEDGYDPSKSFREHLIIYNKVQLEELSFYERRATYFRYYGDRVLVVCIYGIGLHFVFGVKKGSISPKRSITIFGIRVFFVNKWAKITPGTN